ncbi:MAG TPA: alkaline phosphatase family protein [Pseudonocardiaceae bacterium]|nr:alkaline phosphatase family protein [Pseudonocardiaceae bacterium]
MAGQLSSIEHIVVLMLENRSLDHMLGFLYTDAGNISPAGQPYEGLTGTESNPDSSGRPVTVFRIEPDTPNAYYHPGADPGEGYSATNSQLFGSATAPSPPVATNSGFVTDFAYTLGWEKNEKRVIVPGTTANDIMGCFTPATLPVLSGLARGFAVCDHWFSSAPTETLPNRAFALAATSQGHMDDKTHTFTSPSVFGTLSGHAVDWVVYGYDATPLTKGNFPDISGAAASHFGRFADFTAAAKAGSLPGFAFLEPSWGADGNSQHPNYNVALGEQLIHDTYYALRNGPAWASTLLIITYDEHGGCYDHVAPPTGAVKPDNTAGEFGFDFTRFGLRVPTVLVSPLIEAGTVFRVSGTPLDHTSILKTLETRWNLPALTARDAAAPDVSAALTLTQPRTDDPLAGVTVPVAPALPAVENQVSPLEEVQAELLSRQDPPGTPEPALHTPAEFRAYLSRHTA